MMELKLISQEALNKVLKLHKLWLDTDGREGKQADLSNFNLSDFNLSNADLRYANLSITDLRYSDLSNADLRYSDLRGSYLSNADLRGTDLSNANLICADLRGADLSDTDLSDVKYNHLTSFFALQCPEEGSFIGYKKSGDKIVKLLIMEDSLRSSATSRKCRASHVKVLSITSLDGKEEFDMCENTGKYEQKYVRGEEIIIEDFDTDRWNGCSTGIHFFITREEAVLY